MPWAKDSLPDSVKNKDWTDAQKEVFVKTANAVLEKTGNEGEAIATGIKQADAHEEKANAKQFPGMYYCRHMQPGTARYTDGENEEVILVDTDAIKRMIPTGIGKPVYINHQNVDLANLKETASGYIVESFYNELDGWAWFKIIGIDDELHKAVANGYAVSNAYVPTATSDGGTKNNCPYDFEIIDGNFTHLAVVAVPRYEGAKIYTPDEFKIYQETKRRELNELQNSKIEKKGKTMAFELFKMKKEKVNSVDSDTMVEIDGEKVTIGEMITEITNAKKQKMNDDMEIECDGEKMKLAELIEKYNALKKKKNAKAKKNDDEAADEGMDDEVDNADDVEEDDDADDGRGGKQKSDAAKGHKDQTQNKKEKKNDKGDDEEEADHFNELRNAPHKANEMVRVVETSLDQEARGRELY